MPARRPLLCLLFLGSACALGTATPAAGQSPTEPLTPEQVRAVLARIGGLPPDQDPFNEMIRQHIEQRGLRVDPAELQKAIDKIRNDKPLMDRLEKMARERQATGQPANPSELEKTLKKLPLKDLISPNPTGRDFPGPPPETPQGGPATPPQGRPPFEEPGEFKIPDPPPRKDGRDNGLTTRGAPKKGVDPQAPADPLSIPPFDRDNPFADPRLAQRQRTMEAAAALWEQHVGPLDDTPTVRSLLFDVVNGTDGLTAANGNSLLDALGKETGDGTSFADWLGKGGLGGNWRMPSMELGDTSMGRWWGGSGRSSSLGDISGGGSAGRFGSLGGGFGFAGLEGSWLPVVLLAAVLLGGLVWWRFWYQRDPVKTGWEPPEGLGPWPLDPRHIATREDLVRAFEYLSVLICGMEARTWTHGTIAQALTGLAATHGETALLLARLYELARYAPLDEPLSPAELAEGRDIVCRLAGVPTT